MVEPAKTAALAAVLVMRKSALVAVTVTVTVETVDGVVLGVVLVTAATLAIVPETFWATCTTKVMVAIAPAAKLAVVAVNAPVLVASSSEPTPALVLAAALIKLSPVGKMSVTVRPLALEGPALKMTMV